MQGATTKMVDRIGTLMLRAWGFEPLSLACPGSVWVAVECTDE
jgi:hypothetical protein